MHNYVIYCPHLNRDIRGLLANVPNPRIWTGYPTAKGEDGCLECHMGIVDHAISGDYPKVFVMEDDCEFTTHFDYRRWEEDMWWAALEGYDVLVGGSTRTYGEKVVRKSRHGEANIVEVDAFHSAHCIAYFESGYEKVMKAVQPFDYSLGAVTGCRVALTVPFVAVQRPSYSGILQKNVNYVPDYETHEAELLDLIARTA